MFVLVRPTFSAIETGNALPDVFSTRFGADTRVRNRFADRARAVPFLVTGLVNPVASRPVRYEQVSLTHPDGAELTLDIYRPSYLHDRIPVLIVIHGESWAGRHRQRAGRAQWLSGRAGLCGRGDEQPAHGPTVLPERPG